MKFLLKTLSVLSLVLLLDTTVFSKNWNVDRQKSEIGFSVLNLGNTVYGKFKEYVIDLYFDVQNLQKSRVEVSIEVKSIDTQEPKRDRHLQDKSYFHSSKFPYIMFKSDRFEKLADGKYIAYGLLNIKGVERRIVLPFGAIVRENRLNISLQNKINRKDFNVGTGVTANVAIGNEVIIRVNLECE